MWNGSCGISLLSCVGLCCRCNYLSLCHTGNLRGDKTIRLTASQEGLVWRAQAATTQSAFDSALSELDAVNPGAARYLRSLLPERWALHPHFTSTPLFGWRTSNFVESEQARALRLKPRKMLPYEFFRAYTKIIMRECYQQQCNAAEWSINSRYLTPKAESKLQHELQRIPSYVVDFSSLEVCYVSHRSFALETNIEVRLDEPCCRCATWLQHRMPCVHLLAALDAAGRTSDAPKLFARYYTTAAYREHQQLIRLPVDDKLEVDASIRPSLLYAQAGRPRKRRMRSRGELRARDVYRCKQCGARDGHNSATCRHS